MKNTAFALSKTSAAIVSGSSFAVSIIVTDGENVIGFHTAESLIQMRAAIDLALEHPTIQADLATLGGAQKECGVSP